MQDLKLAILIDADNISPKYVKVILDEAASFGVATAKRIYGDWSDVRLKSWKDQLLNNSIIPIQQYSYTTGKNATDSAMIIDAMDLLYSGNLDGFCIVSSDSDFTRLAARLREGGKLVIGEVSKTVQAVINASPEAKALITRHRGIYVSGTKVYRIPVGKGEPVLDIAVDLLRAMAGAVEAAQDEGRG